MYGWKTTVLALLATGLVACAVPPQKRYQDPLGNEAEDCLQTCQTTRFACRAPLQQSQEDCQYRYRVAYRQYHQCQAAGRGDCRKPPTCVSPDYAGCTDAYDHCFVGCGGRIRLGAQPYPLTSPQEGGKQTP